jgi:hypothetical protein
VAFLRGLSWGFTLILNWRAKPVFPWRFSAAFSL